MRRTHPLISAVAIGALVFLYLPMVAVAAFSVNASRHGVTWGGFTLKWYTQLVTNEEVLSRAGNTLILAVASTAIATVLGTLMALGLDRFPLPRWLRGVADTTVELPVVTPDIIFAAAVVVAFYVLGEVLPFFEPSLFTMILAHVTFQVSFVALIVRSRLAVMGKQLDEAARDLYADSMFVFLKVTLPLLTPAIVAGAMLAFTLSLDDFVISFFTSGPKSETLPIYIFGSVRRGVTPEIHALSTLIVVVTVLFVVGVERLTKAKAAAG